jgi:hypothetical protein
VQSRDEACVHGLRPLTFEARRELLDDCDLPAKARANGAEEPHLYHRARLSRFAERRANAVNSALLERCDLA